MLDYLVLNLLKIINILVISLHKLFSCRNKSNGEGIFTFYSENAKEILTDFQAAKLAASSRGKTKESSSLRRRNPLSFLFKSRQDSSPTPSDKQGKSDGGGADRGDEKKRRGRRKVLEKSVSMMENFNSVEEMCREKPVSKRLSMIESESRMTRGGKLPKSSSLSRPRQAPSLSGDQAYFRFVLRSLPSSPSLSPNSCDEWGGRDTPSPPPFPSPPDDGRMKDILKTGDYYRFALLPVCCPNAHLQI